MSEPPMSEAALVIPIPEAEEAVGPHRARLDHAAALGVPAHITVLYPFVEPKRLAESDLEKVTTILSKTEPFDLTLTEVRWFGDDVVWLHPEPVERLLSLMGAVREQFPLLVPYRNPDLEVIPHLTIGQFAELADLKSAAGEVAMQLPIATSATRVDLMVGTDEADSWHVIDTFPLRTVMTPTG